MNKHVLLDGMGHGACLHWPRPGSQGCSHMLPRRLLGKPPPNPFPLPPVNNGWGRGGEGSPPQLASWYLCELPGQVPIAGRVPLPQPQPPKSSIQQLQQSCPAPHFTALGTRARGEKGVLCCADPKPTPLMSKPASCDERPSQQGGSLSPLATVPGKAKSWRSPALKLLVAAARSLGQGVGEQSLPETWTQPSPSSPKPARCQGAHVAEWFPYTPLHPQLLLTGGEVGLGRDTTLAATAMKQTPASFPHSTLPARLWHAAGLGQLRGQKSPFPLPALRQPVNNARIRGCY